jgi:predicted porin
MNAETTTNGTTANVNGINNGGLSSNYWGIRGSEDLGGGLKANFQLEQGIATNTGAIKDGGFDRVSTLGLSGNFGEVKIGRDYTPLYSVINSADVFARTAATTFGLVPVGTRASNMISYETPTFSGFSAKFMTGQNEAVSTTSGITTANTTNSTSGMSATYANGPLMVTAGYGESKGPNDESTVFGSGVTQTALTAKSEGTAISASYDLGVAKLFGNYTQGKTTGAAPSVTVKSEETNIGVSYPIGAFTLLAAYGNNKQTSTGTDRSGDDFVIGAVYSLSKRTSLYAKAGTYNKSSGTLNSAAYDAKTTATAIGVRHTF